MTKQGDVVLVHVDGHPAFFARIEAIAPDVKPDWFQVTLLVLQVPLVVLTWILREAYINGVEFTMGGRPMRITEVVAPEHSEAENSTLSESPSDAAEPAKVPPSEGGKIISLKDRRRKDHSS